MIVEKLKKIPNSCLLLEFEYDRRDSGTCILSCLVEPSEGSKPPCIDRKRWRTKAENPECHKGQYAAAQAAWQSRLPIINIDKKKMTCGSDHSTVSSMNCRDSEMASQIKGAMGSKCKKALRLIGSKHVFQKGKGRKNLLELVQENPGGKRINSCIWPAE